MEPLYPMRINKYLAHQKIATRRGADALITKKQILINGRVAVLGDKVNIGDEVLVKRGAKRTDYVYYAYNKPAGIVTHSPQNGDKDITQSVALKGLFPIGRLDKDSHGLIILTNDGRITDALLNPDYEHEKEYIVKTREDLRNNFKDKMEGGVNIEGYVTKPCRVKVLGEKTFRVILTEGKKHQLRRMVVALFNDVVDLKRTRINNVSLGDLKPNQYRELIGDEKREFLQTLGIQSSN